MEIRYAAQVLSGLVAAFAVFPLGSAIAQVGESGYSLPLALAMKAATKAIATCASNGYPVSAVVVDPSGVIKLEAKGDHSTIHTTTSAFRKAYTVVTFGPIFRFDASSAFAALAPKIRAVQRSRRCPTLHCSRRGRDQGRRRSRRCARCRGFAGRRQG
jgi:Uncharacterized protein, possibly involved in utilization of glycolate and propanediol